MVLCKSDVTHISGHQKQLSNLSNGIKDRHLLRDLILSQVFALLEFLFG